MSKAARYEVIDQSHGKGGFGEISKQHDKALDRLVAVKRLTLIADDELKQRFEREAKILAKMSHPNIPAIYDVDFGDAEMLIYFQFIDGENLRQIINSGVTPSIQQAVPWFTQVALALEHASGLGLIHRDIKPENIIISHNRTAAYLVDFGIALSVDEIRRISNPLYVIGTELYMSPEQRNGDDLDTRSDIYSLGLTLYETLSGDLPPVGQQYEPLSDANEAIPPSIDELIKVCIASDRNRRLASASDFALQLQNAFKTNIPLSKLLMDSPLHVLQSALQNMSAEEFSAKPKGQKLLIITRAKDLIRTNKPQLQKPTADLLATLVRLAIDEPPSQYRFIVDSAYEWGYEKQFGEKWHGDEDVRAELINASKVASPNTHAVLTSSLLEFAAKVGLEGKDKWYYHDLRRNLTALLANPHCIDAADNVAELYNHVNEISHV